MLIELLCNTALGAGETAMNKPNKKKQAKGFTFIESHVWGTGKN